MSRENKVLADARAQFDSRFAKADRVMLYAEIIALLGAEQFTWKGLPDNGINSHCAACLLIQVMPLLIMYRTFRQLAKALQLPRQSLLAFLIKTE